MSKKYVSIGNILKPTATQGELRIDIGPDFLEDFEQLDHFFLFENGTYVPHFIEYIKQTNHLILKIEEIDDPESASNFSSKEIFLKESDITSSTFIDQNDKQNLVGFTIWSENLVIGAIESIELFPQQVMAVVSYQNKSIFVPLVDQLIVEIDDDSKIVRMELPDGFLEI